MLKHVNLEFRNRYFGGSIFLPCQLTFWFNTYQSLQDNRGNFLNMNIAGNHFLSGSEMEDTANLRQNCPKKAIRNFCNFERKRLKKNNCKLH